MCESVLGVDCCGCALWCPCMIGDGGGRESSGSAGTAQSSDGNSGVGWWSWLLVVPRVVEGVVGDTGVVVVMGLAVQAKLSSLLLKSFECASSHVGRCMRAISFMHFSVSAGVCFRFWSF